MNNISIEAEDTVIKALDHPERRDILRMVNNSEKGLRYTDLMAEIGLPTGKLNYQLRQLEGLLQKNTDGKYLLTPLGKKAVALLGFIREGLDASYEMYLNSARLAQRSKLRPLTSALIKGLIGFDLLFLFIWTIVGYMAISEGAPMIVLFLLPVLLVLGIGALVWLIRAFRSAPEMAERWERKIR